MPRNAGAGGAVFASVLNTSPGECSPRLKDLADPVAQAFHFPRPRLPICLTVSAEHPQRSSRPSGVKGRRSSMLIYLEQSVQKGTLQGLRLCPFRREPGLPFIRLGEDRRHGLRMDWPDLGVRIGR